MVDETVIENPAWNHFQELPIFLKNEQQTGLSLGMRSEASAWLLSNLVWKSFWLPLRFTQEIILTFFLVLHSCNWFLQGMAPKKTNKQNTINKHSLFKELLKFPFSCTNLSIFRTKECLSTGIVSNFLQITVQISTFVRLYERKKAKKKDRTETETPMAIVSRFKDCTGPNTWNSRRDTLKGISWSTK